MERFIADLVKNFESGKLDRREFCKTVALAATVYAAGDAAQAQATRGFKVLGVNHLSYTCPDYTRARDFQINVFGLENGPGHDTGKRANLMFGPQPGNGGSFVVARNAGSPNEASSARAGLYRSFLLHAFQLGGRRVRAAMKAKGQEISGGSRAAVVHVLDPFNYDVVQFANIIEEKRVPPLGSGENFHGRVCRTEAQRLRDRQDQPPQVSIESLTLGRHHGSTRPTASRRKPIRRSRRSWSITFRTLAPISGRRAIGIRRSSTWTRSGTTIPQTPPCRQARRASSPTTSPPRTCR